MTTTTSVTTVTESTSTGSRFVATTMTSYSTSSWTTAGGTVIMLVTEFDTVYGYLMGAAARAVGGLIEATNKLVVFAPYLAFFGLVAVAVTVVAVAPWKRPEKHTRQCAASVRLDVMFGSG